MTFTLAQLPAALEPTRSIVPRSGYRLWKLIVREWPRRVGMPRCLAVVEFDYWPGGSSRRCVNVSARVVHDEEHAETWLADVSVEVPVVMKEAICGDVLDSLRSMGVIS